jgi:peptidoglycan hydrolase CwlO-like protein
LKKPNVKEDYRMLLEPIKTRIIAGFVVIFTLVVGLLSFQVYVLKKRVSEYQMLLGRYVERLSQLQSERDKLQEIVENVNSKTRVINKTVEKQAKASEKLQKQIKKIEKVIKKKRMV